MFKLIVLLLALVAISQAYIIIETYSDTNCNETAFVARFISNDPFLCNQRKRGLMTVNFCDSTTFPGVAYGFDWSGCDTTANSDLTFPDGWQSVKFVEDSSCNFTTSQPQNSSAIGAPQPLQNTPIVVFTSTLSQLLASNTTMSCGVDGTLAFASCSSFAGQQVCLNYALSNSVCTPDNFQMTYGLQTSCVTPPGATPMGEAMTNVPMATPVSGPVAAPVKTPVKAPTSKTSAASLLFGSAVLLPLIILA